MTTLLFVAQAVGLRALLVGLGLVGIVFGGLSAVGSRHAKRMLAYSTLGQVGFILIGIGWGTPAALAAAIVFTLNHSLIKSAMLMLAGAVASRAVPKSAAFDAVVGVGRSLPLAGALFLLGGLGLAGIPPTNGFISKLAIFRSGLDLGATSALALAAAASLLTLIYATRAFQVIWWNPPASVSEAEGKAGDALLAPAILIGLCLAIGLWPEPILRLAQGVAAWLVSPELYIRAVLGG
jgi:multicomponent Na+:H+ antiporter subunit D